MKMENIYAGSEEKYVKTVVVYADADDGHVFYDSAKSQKIDKADLLDLFLKGMVINLSGEYLKPVSYKDAGAHAVVTAVHEDSTVVALNFHSAEYSAY